MGQDAFDGIIDLSQMGQMTQIYGTQFKIGSIKEKQKQMNDCQG